MSAKKDFFTVDLLEPRFRREDLIEAPLVIERGDEDVASNDPEAASFEGMLAYIQAHSLLPDDYNYDGSVIASLTVESAAASLTRHNTDNLTRLRAILLLGHSPCKTALTALVAFAESGAPLADAAGYALRECLSLFMATYADLGPRERGSGDVDMTSEPVDIIKI